MFSLIRAALILTLWLGGLCQAAAPSAAVDCPPGTSPNTESYQNPVTMEITTVVVGCSPNSGGGHSHESGGGTCHDQRGDEIPCTEPALGAVWFSSANCYATRMDPQPPADSPLWDGHPPSEGSIWLCVKIYGPSGAVGATFFVPNGAEPMVDPRVLAQRALARMKLTTPDIHMAPTPPDMTYVGLDTWLWMDPNQFNRLRMTVSAGGASVRVTAEPVRAWWDMGDGDGAICRSAGRPWVKGMTSAERTDCSYTYQRVSDFEPNEVFAIQVSLVYRVDWTCTGACLTRDGTLGEVDGPTATGSVRVGERQSVVVGGNQ